MLRGSANFRALRAGGRFCSAVISCLGSSFIVTDSLLAADRNVSTMTASLFPYWEAGSL
jgi:hypothetical protein